jgi:arylsulfatase A
MKNTLQLFFLLLSFNLSAQSPNFVFILADDMGWNGTSFQVSPTETGSMSDFYETPNLVQLASEGMIFSQAYSPAPNCAPTRNSILTGEAPARNSFTTVGGGQTPDRILISGINDNSMDNGDITIAEWLNSTNLDYRTAHYGKWHIEAGGPGANGFSHDDGNTNNGTGDAGDGQVIQTDPKKMMDLTSKGITFMQDAVTANEPFYLQLSHYAVHTLVETTQAAQDYFTTKPSGAVHNNIDYAGMTRDFDDAIGVLLAEITNLGITGNTYVIFMSDNGAQTNQSSNAPLYRNKSYIREGGIRVPMIVKGPNIPANTTNAEPVVGYDLFPTIADWTGSSAALPSTLDGTSIKNLTLQAAFNRGEPVYFHSPHYGNGPKTPSSAATQGDYKLIINYESGVDNLFNLNADVSEVTANDIAEANPAIVLDLKIQLRDHLKEINANMPSLDPTHANFSGTAPDIDGDGLDDEWEFRELLTYHLGPTDDPDNDGDNNLTEQTNGTDPLVDETVLAINEISNFWVTIYDQNDVLLSWQNELNNTVNSYEIEHSKDSNNWKEIGSVSSSKSRFIHEDVENGLHYYRLKTRRVSGIVDYSTIAQIVMKNGDFIRLFPNPTQDIINLEFHPSSLSNAMIEVQVYRLGGQLVQTFKDQKSDVLTFSLTDIKNGIYTIKIFEDGRLSGTEKVVLMNQK